MLHAISNDPLGAASGFYHTLQYCTVLDWTPSQNVSRVEEGGVFWVFNAVVDRSVMGG